MAIVFPVPVDATYDYVPITGPQVQIGTDLVSSWTVRAAVTSAFGPSDPDNANEVWVYFMVTFNPDKTATVGYAFFPETPASQPNNWWERMALWRRAPKLGDGETLTAGDGSEWIYPAGEDGRLVCYFPGTTYARGARRFRGQLTSDPKDLWICDDPDWDWLPVTSGDQVAVGDTVTFILTQHAAVDHIDVVDNESYRRHLFYAGTDLFMDPFAVWDEIIYQDPTWTVLNSFNLFERLPKPTADTHFRAPDGSRWVFTSDGVYYCWGRGTAYSPGAVFHRGEIAGGLTAIIT